MGSVEIALCKAAFYSIRPLLQKGTIYLNTPRMEECVYVPESIKTECPQETTKQARKYAKYTESMIIIDRAFHYVSFTCIFSTHIMIIQCHSCLKALIYIHNLALLPSHKWNHSHTTLLCSLEFELVTSPCNACRGGHRYYHHIVYSYHTPTDAPGLSPAHKHNAPLVWRL